jgi:redox-sensitive bicupin YhaK (pirin superfamily)
MTPDATVRIRRAQDRFTSRLEWLDSRHTFSFGGHHHPDHMGFRTLRVINDDRITPGAGFGTHGHRDMEILSFVVDGALEHKDSMGNGSVIRPGEVQRMSAGTGVRHSEFNHRRDASSRFLQVWILPERSGIEPSYEQKKFDDRAGLQLVGSREARDGSVKVHQDVDIWAGKLGEGHEAIHRVALGRGLWVQVVLGEVEVNGRVLAEGDGAAIEGSSEVTLKGKSDARFLVFDLA